MSQRALMIYIFAWAAYFTYQAYKISKGDKGEDERLRLYLTMLWNPFWRLTAREILMSQDAGYRRYITKLEIAKYAAVFTVAIGRLLVLTLQKIMISGA